MAASQYSGPLPPATELVKYNEACPGAAERIIAMAENQAKHRQEMERTESRNRMKLSIVAMSCSTICVIVLSGIIAYAIHEGAVGAAIATSISAIAAVAGLFFYHKRQS